MNKLLSVFCGIVILLTASRGDAQPASASAQFLVAQGAANYEIKLKVPPGTRGVDPALTVEYSSMGDEGLIGTGFDIGGLSEIVRCPASLLQDGFSGAVSYDANDRFCIDAGAVTDGRLVPDSSVAGAYYAPNQAIVYHTEVESFRKIVPSQNACGSGPCSFDVWLKDGSHLQYNAVTPAVDSGNGIPAGSIRAWQLSSVADLHGNTYTISYSQTPTDTLGNPIPGTANAGVSYPTRIDYTSGPGGLVAQRSVQFYYQASSNAVFKYQGGAMVKRAARLAEIQTCINASGIASQSCSNAVLVNRYVFSYAGNAPTGRSRLSSFGECDGNGNCLAPIQFNWSADATTLTNRQVTGAAVQTSSSYVGDFDGNGLTDLLSVVPGRDQLMLRQPTGFNTTTNTGLNLDGVTATWIADFNGDGLSDVYAHGIRDTLFLSTGNFANPGQGFSSSTIANLKFLTYTFVADVNGDGMADFFTSTANTGLLYLSSGNGFIVQAEVSGIQITGNSTTWLADFNGDNMADLLTEKNGSAAYLSLSTGTGFTSSNNAIPLDLSGAFTYVADFNGDGLNDVLSADGSSGTLSVGTGSGFVANTLSGLVFQPNNNWIGDFNGDGRADIFSLSGGGGTIQMSNGNGFDNFPITGVSLAPQATWAGDFNGDGLTDFTSFQGNSYWDALGSPAAGVPTSNQHPGLLVSIENRLGGQISINYKPITDPTVYSATGNAGNGQFDNKAVLNHYHATPLSPNLSSLYPLGTQLQRVGFTVVANYSLSNDANVNNAAYSYQRLFSYTSALTNLLGRGFLGFGTTTRIEPELNRQIVRTYRQDFPFDREIHTEVTSDTRTQQALQTKTYVFQCTDGVNFNNCEVSNTGYEPNGTRVFQALLQSRSTADSLLGTTVTRTNAYDNYGNVTMFLDSGNSLGSAKAVYTCQSFFNDTNAWRLGYLTFLQSANADCSANPTGWNTNSLRLTQYVRDPASLEVLATAGWFQQAGVWQGKISQRDSWGNVVSRGVLRSATLTPTTAPLPGTSYTTAIDGVFHTFAVQQQSPVPGAPQAPALVTQYATDARSGERVAVVKPSGKYTVHCFDGFEREILRQGPPPNASVVATDANCLVAGSYVAGTVNLPKTVVTLGASTWEQASNKSITNSSSVLPAWAVSGGKNSRPRTKGAKSAIAEWPTVVRIQDGLSRTVQSVRTSEASPVVTSRLYLDPGQLLSLSSLPYLASNADKGIPNVSWTYDALGRTLSRTAPYTAAGNQAASTTTRWTRSNNNTVSVTYGADSDVSYVTNLSYDYFGSHRRLTGMSVPNTAIVRSYDYGLLGEAKSSTGPVPQGGTSGVTMQLTYDSLGRISTVTENGLGTSTYQYDDVGNLHTVTDARGQIYTRSYDALQRLTLEQWSDGNGPVTLQTKWTWDVGEGTSAYGHVVSVAVSNPVTGANLASTQYQYDGRGRVSSRNVTINGKTSTFGYQYLPPGAISSVTYPNNMTATWAYTPIGAISSVQTTNAALGTTSFSNHTATAQAQQINYGNGTSAELSYDANGMLQTRVVRDTSNTPMLAEAYVRDSLLRVTKIIDCLAIANASNALCAPTKVQAANSVDMSSSYEFTDLRLTQSLSGGKQYDFGYDPAGNLFQISGNTLPVSGQQLGCQPTMAISWCYDANGNLSSVTSAATVRGYQYDAKNQLLSAASGENLLASFGYDHSGQRISKTTYAADGKTVAGTTTWPSENFVESLDSSGTTTGDTTYITGPTGILASISANESAGDPQSKFGGNNKSNASAGTTNVTFYAQNSTLNTQLITDGAGKLVARLEYGPYGDIASIAPSGAAPAQRLFGGNVLDAETGLYQFGARYYDPGTGRFLTADNQLGGGLERQDAFHRYAFTLNDPSSYVDPTGHQACVPLGAAVGITSAVIAGIGSGLSATWDTDIHKTGASFNVVAASFGTGATLAAATWATCTYYRDRIERRANENNDNDDDDNDPSDDDAVEDDHGNGNNANEGGESEEDDSDSSIGNEDDATSSTDGTSSTEESTSSDSTSSSDASSSSGTDESVSSTESSEAEEIVDNGLSASGKVGGDEVTTAVTNASEELDVEMEAVVEEVVEDVLEEIAIDALLML